MQGLPIELKERITGELLEARYACALSIVNKEFAGLLKEYISKTKAEFDELTSKRSKVVRRMPKGQPRNFDEEQVYDAWSKEYDEVTDRVVAFKKKHMAQAHTNHTACVACSNKNCKKNYFLYI